jgi:hypothetical protein
LTSLSAEQFPRWSADRGGVVCCVKRIGARPRALYAVQFGSFISMNLIGVKWSPDTRQEMIIEVFIG